MNATSKSPALEDLHAQLLHLVTRYSCQPQNHLAEAVTHQLKRILDHPLIDVFPQLKQQCVASLAIWRTRTGFKPIPQAATEMVLH